MYGWRGRIGVIISPPNTVVENEFVRMAPNGVSIHAARLRRPEGVPGQLSSEVVLDTNQDLPQAAGSMTELNLGVVVFAHTAGSMMRGPTYDAQLGQMLGETTGCPAVTTASAVVNALKKGGVKKLAILTPYPEEMTIKEVGYLEEAIPMLHLALEAYRHTLGEEHRGTLNTMNNLAAAYADAGRLDQASALFEQALEIQRAYLGPGHPETLGTQANLATSYNMLGRTDEAIGLLEETLEAQISTLGAEHPSAGSTRLKLSFMYHRAGRDDDLARLVNDDEEP